jgi:hypothetical protein
MLRPWKNAAFLIKKEACPHYSMFLEGKKMGELNISFRGDELIVVCRKVSRIGAQMLEKFCHKNNKSFSSMFLQQQYEDTNIVDRATWLEWRNTCGDVFFTRGALWENLLFDNVEMTVEYFNKNFEFDAELISYDFDINKIGLRNCIIEKPTAEKGFVIVCGILTVQREPPCSMYAYSNIIDGNFNDGKLEIQLQNLRNLGIPKDILIGINYDGRKLKGTGWANTDESPKLLMSNPRWTTSVKTEHLCLDK